MGACACGQWGTHRLGAVKGAVRRQSSRVVVQGAGCGMWRMQPPEGASQMEVHSCMPIIRMSFACSGFALTCSFVQAHAHRVHQGVRTQAPVLACILRLHGHPLKTQACSSFCSSLKCTLASWCWRKLPVKAHKCHAMHYLVFLPLPFAMLQLQNYHPPQTFSITLHQKHARAQGLLHEIHPRAPPSACPLLFSAAALPWDAHCTSVLQAALQSMRAHARTINICTQCTVHSLCARTHIHTLTVTHKSTQTEPYAHIRLPVCVCAGSGA